MSPLPALNPPDAALLARYLLADENLNSFLAATPSADPASALLTILRFLARPDILPWLDHDRAIRSQARQHAALDSLSSLLHATTDPTNLRLAATALLRYNRLRPPRHADPQPTLTRAMSTRGRTPLRHPAAPPESLQPHATPSTPDPTPAASHHRILPDLAGSSITPPPHPQPSALDLEPGEIERLLDVPPSVLDSGVQHDNAADQRPDPHGNRHDDELADHLADHLADQFEDELEDRLQDDLEDRLTAEAAARDPLLASALSGDLDAITRLYLERTGAPPDPALAAALHRALSPPINPEISPDLHGPHG